MMRKMLLIALFMACILQFGTGRSVNESMAESALEGAEEDINFMKENGIPVNQARYLLQQAEKAHRRARFAERLENDMNISEEVREELEGIETSDTNFSRVVEFTDRISEMRDSTVILRDELVALNYGLKDAHEKGADVEDVNMLLRESWSLFYDEQFNAAEARAARTRSELEDAMSENTTLNLFFFLDRGFLRAYGLQLFVFLIFVSPGLVLTFFIYRFLHIRERIEKLSSERKVLESLIENVQEDYFVGNDISRSIYDSRIKVYRDRYERVITTLEGLESDYERLSRFFWFD